MGQLWKGEMAVQLQEIHQASGQTELEWRLKLWQELKGSGEAEETTASRVRELGIYSGARGTYADKIRTRKVSGDEFGVAVSLLHTGRHYADDLSATDLLYHYPATQQPGHDRSDIEANKNAGRFRIPVFVVTHPEPKSRTRRIRLGWIEDWDDDQRIFLVALADSAGKTPPPDEPESPFTLIMRSNGTKTQVAISRPNQQRFSFQVLKRYGSQCAVCEVSGEGLVDAAHLCPKASDGTDDARNGLPLCALHHRALDTGYFAIHPSSMAIVLSAKAKTATSLLIGRNDICHLKARPHTEALEWLWSNFQKRPLSGQ